jgi:hypothetical protein
MFEKENEGRKEER